MILEFFSILRGDLAKRIYSKLDGRVEAVFGDSIETVEQSESEVRVSFRHEPPRCFDLVIGADGLHSTVRSIAFGNEAEFEKYLGYTTAAFSADAYPHQVTRLMAVGPIGRWLFGRMIADRFPLPDYAPAASLLC
jgi:2-polyprenyl-6-methoxyphenol hydroxylase-like FAD-dependent oxidoreductase